MSNNEIKKVENFPRFKRLKSLFLANNHIVKIDPNIGKQLLSLQHLILSNNRIAKFSEVDNLKVDTSRPCRPSGPGPAPARASHTRLRCSPGSLHTFRGGAGCAHLPALAACHPRPAPRAG